VVVAMPSEKENFKNNAKKKQITIEELGLLVWPIGG